MSHTYTIPLLVSSSAQAGAVNVSSDGSRFEIVLEQPLRIPHDAFDCSVEVQEATVWWTTPNISAALGNNQFYFEEGGNNHVLVIADGLYSASSLSETLEREIVEASGLTGLLILVGDGPTQRVNLNLETAGLQVDFTPADTPRDLLGFNAGLVPPGGVTTGEEHTLGDNVAAFNSVDHFLIHSDLVNSGIRVDGDFNRTIARVSISVSPGSQIVMEPNNPVRVDGNNLIGNSRERIAFWLTDQDDRPADTNGEIWTATVILRFNTDRKRKLSIR